MARTRAAARADENTSAAGGGTGKITPNACRIAKSTRTNKKNVAPTKKTDAARSGLALALPADSSVHAAVGIVPASILAAQDTIPVIAGAVLDPMTAALSRAPANIPTEVGVGEGPAILSKRTRDGRGREPQKRARRDFNRTVTVVVGSGQHVEEFTIHEDHICKVSPFFAAACSENWLEGQTRTIRLPTYQPQTFRQYVEWVYSGRVNLTEQKDKYVAVASASGDTSEITPAAKVELRRRKAPNLAHSYCQVWLIADYLNDTACQEACIHKLAGQVVATKNRGLHLSTVELVSSETSKESKLFSWMVDTVALDLAHSSKSAEYMTGFRERLPEVVKDVLLEKAFSHIRTGQDLVGKGGKSQDNGGTSVVKADGRLSIWWD